MKTIFHKAEDRGFANHGWLKAAHSFSFASYYDREKVNFGKLRVLNDDIVAPARGFDLHQHQDMEIITIPLSGSIRHRDNMGNQEIISAGEVQVMSAGFGIWHSEHNASSMEELNLFQIWIITNKVGHNPRYDQKFFRNHRNEPINGNYLYHPMERKIHFGLIRMLLFRFSTAKKLALRFTT